MDERVSGMDVIRAGRNLSRRGVIWLGVIQGGWGPCVFLESAVIVSLIFRKFNINSIVNNKS